MVQPLEMSRLRAQLLPAAQAVHVQGRDTGMALAVRFIELGPLLP